MNSFEYGALTIHPEIVNNNCIFRWEGTSDNKELINALEPYYLSKIEETKDYNLIIDFTNLKAMNSSSVPAIIGWMKALKENNKSATFHYKKDSNWQKASFRLLTGIGKGFNIEVIAV
jgi:hypothetical protein